MSYLDPPPMPAPVVVMKDVGGYVNEYQNQTELYRLTDREVRLHECRSACTLALSLPNVCVYPDSTLKFHLAYDPRNHQSNYDVSQQLFNAYPAAVRERLGSLTRQYKVLRGGELIALGVRDCNAPRPREPQIMLASNAARKASPVEAQASADRPGSIFGGLIRNVASVFGGKTEPARERIEARLTSTKPPSSEQVASDAPMPPLRPPEIAVSDASKNDAATAAGAGAPPPQRPQITYAYGMAPVRLPEVLGGAQPILPTRFVAYAELVR